MQTREIDDLRAQLVALQQKRNDSKSHNEHNKQNKSYLEHVLLTSDQYTEIDELLTRYAHPQTNKSGPHKG